MIQFLVVLNKHQCSLMLNLLCRIPDGMHPHDRLSSPYGSEAPSATDDGYGTRGTYNYGGAPPRMTSPPTTGQPVMMSSQQDLRSGARPPPNSSYPPSGDNRHYRPYQDDAPRPYQDDAPFSDLASDMNPLDERFSEQESSVRDYNDQSAMQGNPSGGGANWMPPNGGMRRVAENGFPPDGSLRDLSAGTAGLRLDGPPYGQGL